MFLDIRSQAVNYTPMSAIERYQRYSDRKRAQGLCTRCGRRPLKTKWHCVICAVKTRLAAASVEFAYLCDHKLRAVCPPGDGH